VATAELTFVVRRRRCGTRLLAAARSPVAK